MDLERHYDGGNFLAVGDHIVKIKGHRLVTANSGSEGVEYTGANEHGKEGKITFWLTENAMGRLGAFAKNCGLERSKAKNFEYAMLHGLEVAFVVRMEPNRTDPNKSYATVIDHFPAEQLGKGLQRPLEPESAPRPSEQPTHEDVPF